MFNMANITVLLHMSSMANITVLLHMSSMANITVLLHMFSAHLVNNSGGVHMFKCQCSFEHICKASLQILKWRIFPLSQSCLTQIMYRVC
jgi:hypothetical protein